MTREEAKQVFLSRGYVEVEGGAIYDADKWRESCRVISEWLEQEPCEDAISRQDAYKCLEIHGDYDTLNEVYESLQKLPSVKPQEPKTGYWTRKLIRNEKGGCIGAKMICSRCDNDNKHDEYMNYCPNCGCCMIESQERSE